MASFAAELAGLDPADTKTAKALHKIPTEPKNSKNIRLTINKRITTLSPVYPNERHQADLLYLPNDKGFKYLLVVVDLATRRVGAQPLRDKTAPAVARALKKLYDTDKELKPPEAMQVDGGLEFKGQTAAFLKDNDTYIRVGLRGRHQQQSIVENANQVIGNAILLLQETKELKTGKDSREWLSALPKIIERLNEKWQRSSKEVAEMIKAREKRVKAALSGKEGPIFPTKKGQRLLPPGTMVRVRLEEPESVLGKKLPLGHTKSGFRSADTRWEVKPREIVDILLVPGAEPRYIVKGRPNVTYGRWEVDVHI